MLAKFRQVLLVLGWGAVTLSATAADITGAGATFPYPLYSKMFSEYNKSNGLKVNYQSIGSGGGIRQITNQTVDFGASDSFLDDAALRAVKTGKLLHIPIAS